jgi:nucleoside-diphosphate-sugar epimerase
LPFWSGRGQGFELQWDIEAQPCPGLPGGAVVLHLAAVVGATTPQERARALRLGAAVAEACRSHGARALLAASSASVYAPSARPAQEHAALAPVTANGRSKAETEAALVRDCAAAGPGQAVPLALLRIGNIPGADALFGPRPAAAPEILLDPVPGREGGPVRSWIGPRMLGRALAQLCRLAAEGPPLLPPVLNLAQDPPLAMADLLDASGLSWSYGPSRPGVVADAVLCTERLRQVCPLPPASPAGLMAELRALAPERLP